MATIEVACVEIGTAVIVQWGDHGRRIKSVRATVAKYSCLTECRNDQVDTANLEAVG